MVKEHKEAPTIARCNEEQACRVENWTAMHRAYVRRLARLAAKRHLKHSLLVGLAGFLFIIGLWLFGPALMLMFWTVDCALDSSVTELAHRCAAERLNSNLSGMPFAGALWLGVGWGFVCFCGFWLTGRH